MPTLNWIGKDAVVKHHKEVPFRMLQPVAELSYGEASSPENENLIVQGDNLHALKALLPRYAGQVKCIYIDPPYNTGNEGWVYNDNVNSPEIKRWLGEVVGKEGETLDRHDRWLCMMYPRLLLLKQFLREDGVIFVSIDDNEAASLKLLLDEVFGSGCFINQISAKMKQTSGASGGGEDKKLKKNIEYIMIYARSESKFTRFNEVYDEEPLMSHIEEMRLGGKSWKYTRVLLDEGERTFLDETVDGSGMPIKIFKHTGYLIRTISDLMEAEKITEEECYLKYYDKVFRDTNAQTSIRTRVMEVVNGLGDFFTAEYVPKSGRNKGVTTKVYFKGNNCDLFAWLRDIVVKRKKQLVKLEKLSTYWEGFPLNNLTKEGGVQLANGKKPELLIEKIIALATGAGDLVLDSFAGSGTTAAVCHKLKRRWITIETGDHAITHVAARLKSVVNNTDTGGITAKVNWAGGGGFKFCKLSHEALFTAEGQIRSDVTFAELAEFVWFTETGTGYPKGLKPSPLLGTYKGKAIYLLFNGILKDRGDLGGNVLNNRTLAVLPDHEGQRVVYGARSRFDKAKLSRMKIEFKQLPYELTIKSWV